MTAQIAACVRLRTRSLRRIALMWTLTVASAMLRRREITLLGSPSTRQRRISTSRADRLVPLAPISQQREIAPAGALASELAI
ncbi:hypothetical protein [Sphingomonas koreensis]|uniref:hypothetical protein n=1 Tax=Sphingomonas koreensis TaxID=93064 RepID=UPI001F497CD2|nr:hypothetical protein [Sphingomonas koreensis]